MNELTNEISLATNQQHSASNQAVQALQAVAGVSRQTASGSVEIRSVTDNLEKLSDKLVSILTN